MLNLPLEKVIAHQGLRDQVRNGNPGRATIVFDDGSRALYEPLHGSIVVRLASVSRIVTLALSGDKAVVRGMMAEELSSQTLAALVRTGICPRELLVNMADAVSASAIRQLDEEQASTLEARQQPPQATRKFLIGGGANSDGNRPGMIEVSAAGIAVGITHLTDSFDEIDQTFSIDAEQVPPLARKLAGLLGLAESTPIDESLDRLTREIKYRHWNPRTLVDSLEQDGVKWNHTWDRSKVPQELMELWKARKS